MYGEFLRYYESRFDSRRDLFLRKAPISSTLRKGSTNPKRDVLDLLKNLFSRGSGKAPG